MDKCLNCDDVKILRGKLEVEHKRFMRYRRALTLACEGDENKVKEFIGKTEQIKCQ